MHDLKYAARQLARHPGFTLVAVLTLALGIGANTAIVTIINTLAFQSVQARDPGSLAGIYQREVENRLNYNFFSFADFVDLSADKSVYSDLAAHNLTSVGIREGDFLRSVSVTVATASYFSVLGVPPLMGRTFLPEEDTSAAQVAVLTYPYWQSLGGRPDIIGSKLSLAPGEFTVVGVMPEGFTGSTPLNRTFFLPTGALPLLWDRPGEPRKNLNDRSRREFMLIARLNPGVRHKTAAPGLELVSKKYPLANPTDKTARELVATELPRFSFSNRPNNFLEKIAPLAAFALTLSGLVLLVACLNLANMLLARGAARRKEIAIRLAIGASRKRVLRQLLTEGFLLALLGGGAGFLLALWSVQALSGQVQEVNLTPRPDLAVWTSLFVLAGAATVLFALGPAWRLASLDVNEDIKQQPGVDGLPGRFNVKNLLVIGQVAISLALLATAALFARSARHVVHAELGIPMGSDFIARLNTSLANYPRARAEQIFTEAENRLAQIPGVESVSSAVMVPFGGEWHSTSVRNAGGSEGVEVNQNVVGSDYFRAVGVPLLRGRDFQRNEAISKPSTPVVIIGAGLAEKLWPGQDPIGRHLEYPGRTNVMEVVGVVPHISWDIFEKQHRENIFIPRGQQFASAMRLHVNVAPNADSAAIMATARKVLNEIDPRMPMTEISTLRSMHLQSSSVRLVNIGAMLFGAFGAVALLLSFMGVYGLKSFHVARRTREIGIRMALGATARDVIRMILKEGSRLVAVGIFIGLGLALLAMNFAGKFLFGVKGLDPLTLISVPVALAVVALIACWLPARRATRINPMTALRCE